jgi:type IV fimbrial biogenesis protein FimT
MMAIKSMQRGFTLIELIVVLSIVAIMASFAVPSFTATVNNQALASVSSDLYTSILQARSEALKTNRVVYVTPTVTGTPTTADWASGWTVFVDNNNNGAYNSADDALVISRPAIPSNVTVTTDTNKASFSFDSRGYLRPLGGGNGSVVFTATGTGRKRWVVISQTGRPRICAPEQNAACVPP